MDKQEIAKLNEQFKDAGPEAVLKWAAGRFGGAFVIASSFGAEDMVLIDMGIQATPNLRVITLDTGRLPEETYQLTDTVRRKYKIQIESFFPDAARIEALVQKKGFHSFRESVDNRKECCRLRKVEPLGRALKGVAAWATGMRHDQGVTRSKIQRFEEDAAHGRVLKINPLVDWKDKDVWDYIRTREVPYNKLHDKGFPSIGCEPCTRAVKKGEDPRAGRWWWENPENKECGIHPPKGAGNEG